MKSPALLLCALLAACGSTVQQRAETAAAGDTASTIAGLSLGAAEANPLGLAALGLKVPLLLYANTLPDDEKAELHSTMAAAWGGATANNICIVVALLSSGGLAPICPMIGLAYGMNEWKGSGMERELIAICKEERAYWGNANLQCDFIKEARK